jgi:hypothetical protein
MACAGLNCGAESLHRASDLKVKAQFVLNFIRLVNWTAIPGEPNPAQLPVCALSNNDFIASVRDAVQDKHVGARTITVRIDPAPEAARCRVLLVDAAQYHNARTALKEVRNSAVLTVGNGPGFLDLGGIFELVIEDHNVRFNAALDAVRRSQLDVSARLLRLAQNLRPENSDAR